MKFPTFNLKDLSKPKESKLFLSIIPTLKEERTQKFTTLALSFITIAFFGLFAISPTLGTITDLQKQLDDSKFVDDSLQKKIANLTTLQTQYTQVASDLPVVYAAVPQTPSIDSFVGQIHSIAALDSVQLNRVQTLPIDLSPGVLQKAKFLAYAFSIEGQGDLPSLEKFMTSLATFNRLLVFDSIDYTRVGKVDLTFRMTIRGMTFFKPGVAL